jgi:RNA polymerase sigma-70 factor (ECF subfamily)
LDERFHILFAKHHADIQAYCLRRLPVHDADEAAADVFTVAWRRIEDVPAGEQALPWLYGVARNAVRNQRRGSTRRLRLVAKAGALHEPPQEGPEIHVLRNAASDEVVAALQTLSSDDQELLRLKTWERLSNKAIASIFDISVQAVESRYARALARFAKKLPAAKPGFGISPLSERKGGEAI